MIAIKSSLPVRKLKVSEEITSLLDSSVITSQIISTRILPQMPTLLQLVLNMTNDIYSSDLWPIYDNFEGSLEKKYLVTTGDIYGKTDFLSFIEKKTDFYKIYTDGSKTIDEVKSAYYDEFMDVTKCFIITYVNNFLVISDSKSVLVALDNSNLSFKSNYLIFKIKNILHELVSNNINIEFLWVPSHRGIAGNERADTASRGPPDEDHKDIIKVPFTDLFLTVKDEMFELWKRIWNIVKVNKGKWYSDIKKDFSIPWYYTVQFESRKFKSVITRMRFGHCLVPSHLHKLRILDDAKCPKCLENDADLKHIIYDCKALVLSVNIGESLW
ncbi:uncharacterized protein LOC121726133 [Aricia agestis]|uniref:uncharacterized protein LOC121726133 n=1 Tax=Aricia agestis TaxID=91739 RepID=UPI001C2018B5|nr:uncharacterized protein LOC121726133 [Aricia agestis]